MKITFRQDLVGGLVSLGVSLVLWFLIPSQILVEEDDEIITAQTFPHLIIGLMALCSVILLVKEIVKLVRKQPTKIVEIDFGRETNALIIIGLLLFYWGLLHWLSFMLSSIIFAFLFLAFVRCYNWKYYLIVAAIVIGVSLFFQNVLNVSLP